MNEDASLPQHSPEDKKTKTPYKEPEDLDLDEIEQAEDVETILEAIPEDSRERVMRAMMHMRYSSSWKGPLPDPKALKAYNECFEGGAKAIFDMAKSQTDHRMATETTVMNRELDQSGLGQKLAFVLALCFLAVAGWLIYCGHDGAGAILGTVDLVALVTVFVVGKTGVLIDIGRKKPSSPEVDDE